MSETGFWDIPLGTRRDLAEETVVVAAACAAGIFEALADEPATAPDLAERLDFELRPTGILLAVLADSGLLRSRNGVYSLTERARSTLADPSADDYAAGGLPLWLDNLGAFTVLPRVLESGGPVEEERSSRESATESDGQVAAEPDEASQDAAAREGERLARFMAAMNAAPRERIRRLVDLCLERAPNAARALDLGGGPGHMSREFARRGLDVVLFDLPETVRFVASEYGLEDEPAIGLEGGDFNEDPLPPGPFDIVLMSNILHIYGPGKNRALLRKVAEVTAEGGVCAIAEFVRGASPRAARFALIMLLKTEEGNTYSREEYVGWLREAGFRDPRLEHLDEDRQLLTALRA
ncbi:MAG: methyltransferase [Longimicrobiales bacterium]